MAQGHRTGTNGVWYKYLAGMEKGSREGVNFFLAKGLDSATSKWLDDPTIYDHETTFEKMSLLARTLGSYAEYLISMGRAGELPDLIHAHDWHTVPAAVLVKQSLQERGVIIPLVFTIHLLSGVALPWHYASEEWCGIRDVARSSRAGGKRVSTLKYSQIWQDVCHNSLEKFGCYTADYITSVSHTYLMNGRLSPQKRIDILLDAVPLVRKAIPETRFLLFLLPSNDSDLARTTLEKAGKYPDNVRVILGRHPSIYLLSHLAADVYAMPSRSEPFGISALEAMVTGNPVVGTSVGGITETVLDLSTNGESGTGILVPQGNVAKLAESLVSLLKIMQLDELSQQGKEDRAGASRKIPLEPIARMVAKNPRLGSKIRENCRNRVMKKFRWTNAGQMALTRYSAARLLAAKTMQS